MSGRHARFVRIPDTNTARLQLPWETDESPTFKRRKPCRVLWTQEDGWVESDE